MTLSNEEAIRQVCALAGELGIDCAPAVIAERSNLALALEPHPIVARIAIATSIVRIGMAWLRREVEIARFLGARGAQVTRPCGTLDAGPHERAGLVISFWERERLEGAVDPAAAGRELARIHAHLRSFRTESLPAWGGWIEARWWSRPRRGAQRSSRSTATHTSGTRSPPIGIGGGTDIHLQLGDGTVEDAIPANVVVPILDVHQPLGGRAVRDREPT